MREKIKGVLKNSAPEVDRPEISAPENESFGHYSTNVAFKLAKSWSMSPVEAAQKLKEKILESDRDKIFSKIDVVNPGFINFWVSDGAFSEELKVILKKKSSYGRRSIVKSQLSRVNLEFVSANPTGPLTMANARGGFLGDVLANVLEFNGAKVTREYYINDAGNQIKTLGASILAAAKKIKWEENYYQGGYVKDLAKKLASKVKKIKKSDIESAKDAVGKLAAAELLKEIKKSLKNAGVSFHIFRSELKDVRGKKLPEKVIQKLRDKNLLAEHDGAMWLKAGAVQEKERVIKKSDGDFTYYPVDLAYHLEKLKKHEHLIDIWGTDHHGNVLPMKKGLEILGADQSKLRIILMQLVRLVKDGKEVKISKRAGNFVLLDDLLKEVGQDAARFFFLMHAPETHMDFDLKLAQERSVKNPVYYVQYAYVRAVNILRKSQIANRKSLKNSSLSLSKGYKLNSDVAQKLIRELIKFPEIIEDTAKDYQVHHLTKYATELARTFHNFYEKERIIGEKDKNLVAFRLQLVLATQIVLGNLLDLLGVAKPKRM